MWKYIVTAFIALALGVGASACDTGSEPATAETPTTTTTTTTTEEPVSDVSSSEELAEQYANAAPKGLAQMCAGTSVIGEERSAQIATRVLGPQIIRQGGDVSEVVEALIERC